MGLLENIKGYFNAFEDEELDEEIAEQAEDKIEAKNKTITNTPIKN